MNTLSWMLELVYKTRQTWRWDVDLWSLHRSKTCWIGDNCNTILPSHAGVVRGPFSDKKLLSVSVPPFVISINRRWYMLLFAAFFVVLFVFSAIYHLIGVADAALTLCRPYLAVTSSPWGHIDMTSPRGTADVILSEPSASWGRNVCHPKAEEDLTKNLWILNIEFLELRKYSESWTTDSYPVAYYYYYCRKH